MKIDISLPGLIAFLVEIEVNGGVHYLPPGYLLKRLEEYCSVEHPEAILFYKEGVKFEEYMRKWSPLLEVNQDGVHKG